MRRRRHRAPNPSPIKAPGISDADQLRKRYAMIVYDRLPADVRRMMQITGNQGAARRLLARNPATMAEAERMWAEMADQWTC